MRLGRSLALGAALALAPVAAAIPRAAGAQELTARFPVDTVMSDTTFRFSVAGVRWAAERRRGIVVDPARRDALVARFRVLGVQGDTVTAAVTGQTTLVTIQHFVVMTPPPPPPWHKRAAFWTGTALGVVAGLIVGGLLF